ncbi:MAG: hypothetical protein Ct9H300mP1_36950 [Planctomycetaceae bacterium]|nr:MAG: hypothetical protein Ct9H300mP1_36950 [Planctomycetaceae bacterium]
MVVSARGSKTDELVGLASEITDTPSAREMDMLLSTGEQESVALMAMAVAAEGAEAISLTGGQMGNSHRFLSYAGEDHRHLNVADA